MTREYCVYMHTAPNGKVYIGQTMQKPEHRFGNGKGYKKCPFLNNAIEKYGWDNFSHEILRDGLTREEADYYEAFYIDLFGSCDRRYGYNLRSGGTSGYSYTDEAKKRMSEKQKGRKQTNQTRAKRSKALLKYYSEHTVSQETREKIRKATAGKTNNSVYTKTTSEKYKAALEAVRGREISADADRIAISNAIGCDVAIIKAAENIAKHQFKKGHAVSEKTKAAVKKATAKKVAQYDKDMNLIAVYPSISDASRAMGFKSVRTVGNAVCGYTKTAGGYVWRYADGNEPKV